MRITAVFAIAFAGCAWAQAVDPDPSLVFEVASVKPAPPPDGRGRAVRAIGIPGGPGATDPGRFTAENFSLPNLILTAYGIPAYRLSAPDLSYGMPMFNVEARTQRLPRTAPGQIVRHGDNER